MEDRIREILESFNGMSAKEKATAIKNLRNLGYNNIEFYKKYLNDKFVPIAIAAKKAIDSINKEKKEEKELSMIKEALENSDKNKKKELYKRLSNLKIKKAKKLLLKGLSEDSWDVMETVIKLVSKDEFIENTEIEKLLSSLSWTERRNSIKVLGLRGAEVLLNYYTAFKNDRNVEVRRAYVEALSNILIEKTILIASYFTHDKNLWVRKEAEKTIKKIKNFIKKKKNEKKMDI